VIRTMTMGGSAGDGWTRLKAAGHGARIQVR
jgi:hypothetical protein